jgi:hypothetical protein
MNFKNLRLIFKDVLDSVTKRKETFVPPKGDTALVILDLQGRYADPKISSRGTSETEQAARNIRIRAQDYRDRGVAVYFVYTLSDNEPFHALRDIDSHRAHPHKRDFVVLSSEKDFHGILREHGRTNILYAGIGTESLCDHAGETRSKGFSVTVLHDLVADDNDGQPIRRERVKNHRARMSLRGIGFKTSTEDLTQRYSPRKAQITPVALRVSNG